jgi:thiamine biosynthesis lipoprotein
MGMPITIICADDQVSATVIDSIFDFFKEVDARYSPYIDTSDVGKINRGELIVEHYSQELHSILELAESTKQQTNGYFDVWHNGVFDPSGIVKGWAIQQAARLLAKHASNFYVEAGGDIQVQGHSASGHPWRIGVRNPFDRTQTVAVVALENGAIATSGTVIRGQHIYDPHGQALPDDVVSLSVIGPKIVDADRFATAAFAMGKKGITFIESLPGFEGYMVDKNKIATMTSGWQKYEEQQV